MVPILSSMSLQTADESLEGASSSLVGYYEGR
jgi:hypothetical protein